MELTTIDWQNESPFDKRGARKALAIDGAVLIRGLLSHEEIEKARKEVRDRLVAGGEAIQLGRTQPNAAILAPEIGWIISHPKIIKIFKDVLDEGMVFTGHCDIHMNMLSGWHKDSGEHVGGYFKGDYFAADDCRVFKAAVYLQDATTSDGLTVALGSHRHVGHKGNVVWVPSKAGDVVLFDVRISHTGQLPDTIENAIKAASRIGGQRKDRHDPAWATLAKQTYWKVIGRRDRLSVFFTFGAANKFTREFSEANMMRQSEQTEQEAAVVPAALDAALRAQGVEIADCCRVLGGGLTW